VSFKNKFPYISVIDKVSDFKFRMLLEFAKAHHQMPPEEKLMWPWARGSPQNLGLPFNISATAEISDFKFGTQLGFAKADHKVTLEEKLGVALG